MFLYISKKFSKNTINDCNYYLNVSLVVSNLVSQLCGDKVLIRAVACRLQTTVIFSTNHSTQLFVCMYYAY